MFGLGWGELLIVGIVLFSVLAIMVRLFGRR